MPGHRDHSLGMSSLLSKSHIKSDNVAAGPTLMEKDDRIRRLNKSPLEIAVYIRTDTAEEDLVPARFDPRNRTCIAGGTAPPKIGPVGKLRRVTMARKLPTNIDMAQIVSCLSQVNMSP